MTLRRPERLIGPEGEYDFSESETRDDFRTILADIERSVLTSLNQPGQQRRYLSRHIAWFESNPVHPLFTDFGPESLINYLRSEIAKLRSVKTSNARDALPSQTNHAGRDIRISEDKSHHSFVGGTDVMTPTLIGESSEQTSTANSPASREGVALQNLTNTNSKIEHSPVVARRSNRLALKEQSSQDTLAAHTTSQPSSSSLRPIIPTPRQRTRLASQSSPSRDTLLPGFSPQNDHASLSTTPGTSGTNATYRTIFEEHTQSKRRVGRNVTAGIPDNSGSSSARLNLDDDERPRKAPGRLAAQQDRRTTGNVMPNDNIPRPRVTTRSITRQELPTRRVSMTHSPTSSDSPGPTSRSSATPADTTCTSDTNPNLQSHVFGDIGESFEEIPSSRPAGRLKTETRTNKTGGLVLEKPRPVVSYPYHHIIPETLPESLLSNFIEAGKQVKAETPGMVKGSRSHDDQSLSMKQNTSTRQEANIDAGLETIEPFPRHLPASSTSPPIGPISGSTRRSLTHTRGRRSLRQANTTVSSNLILEFFNDDLWFDIAKYLSTRDIKNLRLTCKTFAQSFAEIQLRNVVVNFSEALFSTGDGSPDNNSGLPLSNSMFEKHGHNFNQFGIAFEYDLNGFVHAQSKVIEKVQDAWFGKFIWPTKEYPRYPALQAVEDLVDNNHPLLRDAFKYITKASELGLCVNSGHGWLEGSDISDMALFEKRATKGSKIFGKTFRGEDVWHKFSKNEYFKWAQQNTINATMRHLLETAPPGQQLATKELQFLRNVIISDMDSFKKQSKPRDIDRTMHVGGAPGTQAPAQPFMAPVDLAHLPPQHVNVLVRNGIARHQLPHLLRNRGSRYNQPRKHPQWPLIFNGMNLAAEVGGHCNFVQAHTESPRSSPLRPGSLSEAQAQWLMETVWAQRAFLSAYTTAIITNKQNFTGIHTVRISKLSSGLLPSLEQKEFWASLPGLKKLQILIEPDWRQEHIAGDRGFQKSMGISPHKAVQKFTDFLSQYVVRLERLHSLSIGYSGGGEHAVGMFARNQHVLPAPIIDDPADWLFAQPKNPKSNGSPKITKFDHIRELEFENCWFSPSMLKEFMARSCDTSLHSLKLNSVSMLTSHDPNLEQPLTTGSNDLRCMHPPSDWFHETLPTSATWTEVLDSITPGITLLEHKYAHGLLDENVVPKAPRSFRGHVQEIELKSCGYVKISLPTTTKASTFNQFAAVTHLDVPADTGLWQRKDYFVTGRPVGTIANTDRSDELGSVRIGSPWGDNLDNGTFMMGKCGSNGAAYPWLGTLTQCVHPIEKRILEEAWGMVFGWGDTLERWAAVEDGFYEGGTGRFSGTLRKQLSTPGPVAITKPD